MIEAVHAYTKKKVDVLAYSMGSPIARKAILGGRCIDTGRESGQTADSNRRHLCGRGWGQLRLVSMLAPFSYRHMQLLVFAATV